MKYTSRFTPIRRLGAMAGTCVRVALSLIAVCMVLGFAPAAQAIEPVKISRDDTALDLTATTEIYKGRGEAFQVSTAAGADGIAHLVGCWVGNARHGLFLSSMTGLSGLPACVGRAQGSNRQRRKQDQRNHEHEVIVV